MTMKRFSFFYDYYHCRRCRVYLAVAELLLLSYHTRNDITTERDVELEFDGESQREMERRMGVVAIGGNWRREIKLKLGCVQTSS